MPQFIFESFEVHTLLRQGAFESRFHGVVA
jgi:hypothetical protein